MEHTKEALRRQLNPAMLFLWFALIGGIAALESCVLNGTSPDTINTEETR